MTAKVATRRSIIKLGPDATRFDVRTSAGFAAWEQAWADHLGQAADAPITVERTARPGSNEPADPIAKARHAEALAYVRDYTGRWGLPLDIRARDSWGTKYLRLSERQVDALLAGKARDAEWAERAVREVAAKAVAATITEGWYVLGDVVHKVQRNLRGTGMYAKRLDITDDRAEWVYVPGGLRLLGDARRLTVEEAAKFGQLYGFCVVCGRRLTDETSIEAGIGPICKGKLTA